MSGEWLLPWVLGPAVIALVLFVLLFTLQRWWNSEAIVWKCREIKFYCCHPKRQPCYVYLRRLNSPNHVILILAAGPMTYDEALVYIADRLRAPVREQDSYQISYRRRSNTVLPINLKNRLVFFRFGRPAVRRSLSDADMAVGVEKLYGEHHRRLE